MCAARSGPRSPGIRETLGFLVDAETGEEQVRGTGRASGRGLIPGRPEKQPEEHRRAGWVPPEQPRLPVPHAG